MASKNQTLTNKPNKNLLISRCEKPVCIFNKGVLKYLFLHKCYYDHGNLIKISDRAAQALVYLSGNSLPSVFRSYRKSIQENPCELFNYTVPSFDGQELPLFMLVGCGKCSFCRYKHTTALQVRALCESITSETRPISILLTYNNDNLPVSGVSKEHIQKFLKRLRYYLHQDFRDVGYRDNLRYFVCGEYGTDKQRPHYHMILWNFPHHLITESPNKWKYYEAVRDYIAPIWSYGFVSVKYTDDDKNKTTTGVKYAVKYLNKESNIPSYRKVIEDDYGNIFLVTQPQNKPFILFSRGGRNGNLGLGSKWLQEHEHEIIQCSKFEKKYTWCFNGESITAVIPTYFLDKLYPRISNIIPKHIRDKFAALQRAIPFLLVHEDKFEVKGFKSVCDCITNLNSKFWFLPQCDTHYHYYKYNVFLDEVLFGIDDLVKYSIPPNVNKTILQTREDMFLKSMTDVLSKDKYVDLGTCSLDEYFAIRSYYDYKPNPIYPDEQ